MVPAQASNKGGTTVLPRSSLPGEHGQAPDYTRAIFRRLEEFRFFLTARRDNARLQASQLQTGGLLESIGPLHSAGTNDIEPLLAGVPPKVRLVYGASVAEALVGLK